ncbi:MAG: hypothetical protein KAR39_00635 [Thermoplasmata archaeon]|nr:hypothetical protein [Thermoplasmata archaeon]
MTASGGPPPGAPPPGAPPMGGPPPQGAPPPYGYPPGPPVPQKTIKPVIGGLLILLGSLAYLFIGAIYVTAGDLVVGIPGVEGFVSDILMICGIIALLLGIISLLGGVLSMMRKAWGVGLLAGILTIPTLLGLIGLILVAISRDEY